MRTVRGEELVGLEYEGPFDYLPAQAEVVHRVIPWDEVSLEEGTGIVHIAPGAGSEDFELSKVHGPSGACSDRRGRTLLRGLRRVRGAEHGRGREARHRRARPARAHRRARLDRPSVPGLLALRDAARLPNCGRLADLVRRSSRADARRQRHRRVDAGLLLEADGRLAPEHGRLEHLAPALLRPAASVLSVRVRKAERRRVAARAPRARDGRSRPAAGAPPTVGRRGHDRVRVVRPRRAAGGGGRRCVARRRHRPLRDARLAERRVERRRLRDRRVRGALRAPISPTTRTGRSGFPATGSRRCESRSGSGSTRSRSCP